MASVSIRNRRSAARFGGRGSRRRLVWATQSLSSVSVGAGAKLADNDLLTNLEVAGSSVLGATVIRTHMRLVLQFTSTDTSVGVVYGFIVDTAPTVTNLDPSVAFGDKWMLLRSASPVSMDHNSLVGTNYSGGDEINLKSKRKILQLGEKYFFCLTNVGSGSVTVGFFARTLIALP